MLILYHFKNQHFLVALVIFSPTLRSDNTVQGDFHAHLHCNKSPISACCVAQTQLFVLTLVIEGVSEGTLAWQPSSDQL